MRKTILFTLLAVMVPVIAFASYTNFRGGFEVKAPDGTVYYRVGSTGEMEVADGAAPERALGITIFEMAALNAKLDALYDGEGAYKSLTGLVYDSMTPSLVIMPDSTTPAIVTLKIPENYKSGIGFRLAALETGAYQTGSFDGVKFNYDAPNSSPGYVDYTLYVHSDGNWADTTGYPQTAVRLGYDTGKIHEIDLPITFTSDATVIATTDSWVTFQFNLSSAQSLNYLWVQGVEMYYVPEY